MPYFEVESVKDGTPSKFFVDTVTGEISDQKTYWWSFLNFHSPWKSEAFAKIMMPMGKALETAAQATLGTAMNARLKERHGSFFYQVQTVKEGTVKAVLIDPENGKSYQGPEPRHGKCF